MKTGDVLYTGHVATESEARQYNRHQDDCDKIKRIHPFGIKNSDTMVYREYNRALDRKHNLFQIIALS